MPVVVRKRGRKFAIVEKGSGKKVGESTSRARAEASARIRNQVDAQKRRRRR